MSTLGDHQCALTIPDTQFLRQGCSSSVAKQGKDIWAVTVLNPTLLICRRAVVKREREKKKIPGTSFPHVI